MMQTKNILITGGAGFIGSHVGGCLSTSILITGSSTSINSPMYEEIYKER
jgi:nucleoside-diphosphate-sugar epimerase